VNPVIFAEKPVAAQSILPSWLRWKVDLPAHLHAQTLFAQIGQGYLRDFCEGILLHLR